MKTNNILIIFSVLSLSACQIPDSIERDLRDGALTCQSYSSPIAGLECCTLANGKEHCWTDAEN